MDQGSLGQRRREKRTLWRRRGPDLLAICLLVPAALAVACDSFSAPVDSCGQGRIDCGDVAVPAPGGTTFPPKGGFPGMGGSQATGGAAFGGSALGGAATAGTTTAGTSTAGASTTGGTTAGTSTTGGTTSASGSNASAGADNAAGQASAGGADGGGPHGPSICDGKTLTLSLADAYLDDFETATRFGLWYSFSDTSPPNQPLIARVAGGALQTLFSAHASATSITSPQNQGYGAGFGLNLTTPAQSCTKVSVFDGISFWAKGSAGADDVLKVEIMVPATMPSDAIPPGDCSADCYRHPSTTIVVSSDWQHYTLPFTSFTTTKLTWTDRRIMGFIWVTPGPAYDVNIDELTFYQGVAPSGPVTPQASGGAGGSP